MMQTMCKDWALEDETIEVSQNFVESKMNWRKNCDEKLTAEFTANDAIERSHPVWNEEKCEIVLNKFDLRKKQNW